MQLLRETRNPVWLDLPVSGSALFIDLDGTLVNFAPTPLEVRPDERRSRLLRDLYSLMNGRMAIVSGRAVQEIDRILEYSIPTVAGVHGLQIRSASGVLRFAEPHPLLEQAVSVFAEFARHAAGALLEIKPLSVALHYRNEPMAGPSIRRMAAEFAERSGMVLQEGEMVVELLTPGRNKGDAVREFMEETPFTGARPIFVGDDLTDEKGFQAVNAIGGVSVLVGSRENTEARARLKDVAQVMDWLAAALSEKTFRVEMAS